MKRLRAAGRRRDLWLLLGGLLLALVGLWQGQRLTARDSTWQAMQARGSWRVGLDPSFPPFELLNAEGQPVGYDVDLAWAMAERWGLQVEIVPMGFDSLLDSLQAGKIDSVLSALPYDPRLTRDVAYSSPYFEAGIRLVVQEGQPLTGPADLVGRTVAVEWGGGGDAVGRQLQRQHGAIDLLTTETAEEAIAVLADGGATAALVDGVTLRLAQARQLPVVAVGPPLESTGYVIAVPLSATTLLAQIDEALALWQQNGHLIELEERWFGAATTHSHEEDS